MTDLPVYVFSSDKYYWALEIMLYLHQKYWAVPITVFGFSKPGFTLPETAEFVSMGRFEDYPISRWSDAVMGALEKRRESHAVLLLEDYWLIREVDGVAIRRLFEYAEKHKDIGRIDLVTDRLYAGGAQEVDHYHNLDIIECIPPAQYHMSTQASIWNLDCLRKILRPDETAWETELEGTSRMIQQGWRAVGTRQCPVRYIIGVQQGKVALDGGYQVPPPKWRQEDLAIVASMLAKQGR